MVPLLAENVGKPTTVEKFKQTDQNIAGRFFTELVDILVNKGNFSREATERRMSQRIDLLRPQFANMAKRLASECFAASLSSRSMGTSAAAQADVVMQALRDWEHAESVESSECVVSGTTLVGSTYFVQTNNLERAL